MHCEPKLIRLETCRLYSRLISCTRKISTLHLEFKCVCVCVCLVSWLAPCWPCPCKALMQCSDAVGFFRFEGPRVEEQLAVTSGCCPVPTLVGSGTWEKSVNCSADSWGYQLLWIAGNGRPKSVR